ncbi:hypothetical protein WN48_06742 [Eufriesea mexicana]|uniref:Uncharacterized protein n=1 Tax=Eufriesea mexicana TaxID=516756 RepID=A0A310S8E1_9HYME|nr:hypothetical protein WN48_06742 [Eufriesea mexicana]
MANVVSYTGSIVLQVTVPVTVDKSKWRTGDSLVQEASFRNFDYSSMAGSANARAKYHAKAIALQKNRHEELKTSDRRVLQNGYFYVELQRVENRCTNPFISIRTPAGLMQNVIIDLDYQGND